MVSTTAFATTKQTFLHLVILCFLTDCNLAHPAAPGSSAVPGTLASLVPRIDQPRYHLTPDGNQFRLRLFQTGGLRDEVWELKNPGTADQELVARGTETTYFDNGFVLRVTYTADRNGYVAKSLYERADPPLRFGGGAVGILALKSAVG